MKTFKKLLHVLIALGSMIGFLFGWAVLAHSGKPVQPGGQGVLTAPQQALAPLPPLPPIQSIQTGAVSNDNSMQFVVPQVRPSAGFFSGGLTTRGS
jgi:hypothetical protein